MIPINKHWSRLLCALIALMYAIVPSAVRATPQVNPSVSSALIDQDSSTTRPPMGEMVILRAGQAVNRSYVAPPLEFSRQGVQSATINIQYLSNQTNAAGDYCYPWPADAQAAFEYTASVWESQINSTVPIVIQACWTDLDPGVLGYGGAVSYHRDFGGAPTAETWYQAALANALAGSDLNDSDGYDSDQDGSDADADMIIAYSRTFDWYFGADGNTPADKYDFATVVLHEICHGLGFSGSMRVSSGLGSWGFNTGYPVSYDRFTENGSAQQLINTSLFPNPSSALAAQLTSDNVYFNGANANAANGGARPKLYAPGTWQQGSSYSHLDEIYNGTPNSLMTFSLDYGEANHNPGAVAMGMLQDFGWTTGAPQPAPTVTSITPNSGGNNGSVSVTIAGTNFQSGATVKLTRSGQADIVATGASVSASQITCNFNLVGAAAGQWNVVVTNPDSQSGMLPNGFTVNEPFVGKTWTGSASSDWHTAGNWSPSGVPGAGDDVLIPNVARDPVISTGDAAANSLTIDSGAVLDLTTRHLTVEGALTNNGTLKQAKTVSSATQFLRITNQAGTETKYYGVDITPTGDAKATAGLGHPSPIGTAAWDNPDVGPALPVEQPAAPAAPTVWAMGQPMPTARMRLAGASDGCLLYAIGGMLDGGGGYFANNEVYDPQSDNWISLAPMPTARGNTGAAILDGVIYVPAGYNGAYQSTHEAYNIASNSWSSRAPLPTALAGGAVAAVNGKLYHIGGNSSSGHVATTFEYNPTTNAWSTKAPAPSSFAYAGSAVLDGYIYIAGGWLSSSASTSLWRYDPVYDSWTVLASMGQGRQSPGLVAAGGYLYAFGGGVGWTALSDTEQYNLSTNTWAQRSDSPLIVARIGMASGWVRGKIWGVGGSTGSDETTYNEYLDEGYADNCAGAAAPTVSGIIPNTGANTGVVSAAVTGTDFQTGATVKLMRSGQSDIDATDVNVVSASQIMCNFDLNGAAAGQWNVVVTNPDSQSGELTNGFTVTLATGPTVLGIMPNTGINTGTVSVAILGANLQAGATVKLTRSGQPDIAATGVNVVSASQLTCNLNLAGAAAGAWNVVVTNPDAQSGTLPNGFTVMQGTGPAIISIVPNTGVNTGTVSVLITGVNFEMGATIKLVKSGTAQIPITGTNVMLNATQIMCDFDLTGAATGAWHVVVTNPDLKSGTLPDGFTVFAPSAAPIITGITPNTGVNTGTVHISDLSGSNFMMGATVKLTRAGQTPITATNLLMNATRIICDFDLTGAATGAWNVVVTNPDAKSGTLPNGFTVTAPFGVNVTVAVSGNQFCAGRTGGVKRCFDITPDAALDAAVRFYLTEAERNNQTLGDLLVFHYDGAEWVQEAGPYTSGGAGNAQYVQAQNVSDFSRFALAKTGSAIFIYLPVVMKYWPPVPDAPTLNAITPNPSSDGNYTVSWSAGAGPAPTSYDLEENGAVILTDLTGASRSFTGKAVGTYTYRVRGKNSYGPGAWSGAQSVTVKPQLPGTLYSIADASVLEGKPTLNDGTDSTMWVGYEHCSTSLIGRARSLVKFDVSAIPPGTQIVQATLSVYLTGSCDTGNKSRALTAYRTTGDWGETSVNWNNRPDLAEAYGSVTVSSRTWQRYSLDVTNLVRGWVNSTYTNYGLFLRSGESSSDARLSLGTRNAGSSYGPYLSITYAGMTMLSAPQTIEPAQGGCGVASKGDSDVPLAGVENGLFEAVGLPLCPR